jgi:Fe-S-cluster containining protein
MAERVIRDEQPRALFNCSRCPAFCCSVYERVKVTKRDIARLAKHFAVPFETARRRYTKDFEGERVLKRVPDTIFEETCAFLDQETRGCGIYHARPGVCRAYPTTRRCAYYDLLRFERRQQGDETVVPVVRLIFRATREVTVRDEDSSERILEWEGKPNGAASHSSAETRKSKGPSPRDQGEGPEGALQKGGNLKRPSPDSITPICGEEKA